jgi:hypothetical protein
LEKNTFKQWASKTFRPGRCRAARHTRAPAGLDSRTTRCPRPPAGRGVPLPHAPHPEAPRSPPGPRAPRRAVPARGSPRTAGPSAAPRRRRVGQGSRAMVASPCHRDVTGGASPIKTERHALLAPSPPLHRALHCRPPVNSPPRPSLVRLTFLAYSLGALGTCTAARCSALHLPCRSRSLLEPPPPTVAARPRRSRPRSNPGFHRALGEHVVMPHRLPGRERGRLASIRPVPPPPMPKAPIARPPFFLGCLLQTRGMVVMFLIFVGSLVQKGIFTGICKWLKLVKSLENRIKFGKLQTQFC